MVWYFNGFFIGKFFTLSECIGFDIEKDYGYDDIKRLCIEQKHIIPEEYASTVALSLLTEYQRLNGFIGKIQTVSMYIKYKTDENGIFNPNYHE